MTRQKEGYEELLAQINNTLLETDAKIALDILGDIEKRLTGVFAKRLALDEVSLSHLIDMAIPNTREVLEQKLQQQQSKERRKQSKKGKSQFDIDDDYYEYDFEIDDFVEGEPLPTWQELNPDKLAYPVWLAKLGIQEFFPFPDPVVNPIAAIIAVINSAAIPGELTGLSVQAELPLVLCYGLPGVGKTTFCRWLGNHYERDYDEDYSAYQEVKEDTSVKGLRDTFHRASHIPDTDNLRESCVHIDDFQPRHLISERYWAKALGMFIAVQRSQAISRISANGKKDKDELQTKFVYWLLKLISTNNHPKELFTAIPKLERRCIVLPFEKLATDNTLGQYDWSDTRQEYMQLWNKRDRMNVFWKGLLLPMLRRPFSSYKLPSEYVARSITLMATGIYAGIFENEEDAEKQLAAYWEYIKEKTSKGYEDFLITAVQNYLQEKEQQAVPKRSKLGGQKYYVELGFDEILLKCSQSGNREREKEKIQQFLMLQGYQADTQKEGNRWVAKFFKFMETRPEA